MFQFSSAKLQLLPSAFITFVFDRSPFESYN